MMPEAAPGPVLRPVRENYWLELEAATFLNSLIYEIVDL